MKFYVLLFAVILAASFFQTAEATKWTNITCIDGNAYQVFNTTIDNENVFQNHTQECRSQECLDNIGCIDPRDIPGEVFLGTIIIFPILAMLFGYLTIKFDSPETSGYRMLFFLITIIFALMGVLTNYQIIALSYLTELANSFAIGITIMNTVIFIVFAFMFLQFLVNILKGMEYKKRKKVMERRGMF